MFCYRTIITTRPAFFVKHAYMDANLVYLWSYHRTWLDALWCRSSLLVSHLRSSKRSRTTCPKKFRRDGIILSRKSLVTVKLVTKAGNLFCKIAAEQVEKNVARFTIHFQTCFVTNQVFVVSCVNSDFGLV